MATTQDHAPLGPVDIQTLPRAASPFPCSQPEALLVSGSSTSSSSAMFPTSSPMTSASSPPLSSWKLTCSTSAQPCGRRTRSLPVSCPYLVHHLVEPAVPLVGPAPRQGDGLAMCAAAPQPCSDAWRRSPAARYPRALFRNSRAWEACASTPSGFSETTILSSKFIAGPDPSATFSRHPRDQLAPFLDGLASGG